MPCGEKSTGTPSRPGGVGHAPQDRRARPAVGVQNVRPRFQPGEEAAEIRRVVQPRRPHRGGGDERPADRGIFAGEGVGDAHRPARDVRARQRRQQVREVGEHPAAPAADGRGDVQDAQRVARRGNVGFVAQVRRDFTAATRRAAFGRFTLSGHARRRAPTRASRPAPTARRRLGRAARRRLRRPALPRDGRVRLHRQPPGRRAAGAGGARGGDGRPQRRAAGEPAGRVRAAGVERARHRRLPRGGRPLRAGVPPGGQGQRAGERRRPAGLPRRRRHRHRQRPSGRPRGRGQTLRLLGQQQRLRRAADAAQNRGHAPAADEPLRRGEAGRRGVRAGLRRDAGPGRREPAVLQHLRPAAERQQRLRRRDRRLRPRLAGRQAADRLRRRLGVAGLHARRQRRPRQPAGRPARRAARRRGLQRRHGPADDGAGAGADDGDRRRPRGPRRPTSGRRGRGTCRTRWRT